MFIKRKVMLIGWWLTMFVATTIPTNNMQVPQPVGFDKLIHFLIYLVLTVLLYRYLSTKYNGFKKLTSYVVLVGFLYSLVDEFHQPLVGRTCSIYDLYADWAGIIVAVLIVLKMPLIYKVND